MTDAKAGPRMLIVGPPGAGKGTQAARIAQRLGIPAISTGDIFRRNIVDRTALGVEVKAIVDAGDYVPDSLTNKLVADRLAEPDAAAGFLLDGYPRTLDQVAFLDEFLAAAGTRIDLVIQLAADEDELVHRLRGRAAEEGRSDDTEEAIRHRQAVYREQTAPIIEVLRGRGLVAQVDGIGDPDEVSRRIEGALALRGVEVRA
jgi:adenylate kinase